MALRQTDFTGKLLDVGDEVVYIANTRTGTSTVRKIMYKGKIERFTLKLVVMEDGRQVPSNDVVKVKWSE